MLLVTMVFSDANRTCQVTPALWRVLSWRGDRGGCLGGLRHTPKTYLFLLVIDNGGEGYPASAGPDSTKLAHISNSGCVWVSVAAKAGGGGGASCPPQKDVWGKHVFLPPPPSERGRVKKTHNDLIYRGLYMG